MNLINLVENRTIIEAAGIEKLQTTVPTQNLNQKTNVHSKELEETHFFYT